MFEGTKNEYSDEICSQFLGVVLKVQSLWGYHIFEPKVKLVKVLVT